MKKFVVMLVCLILCLGCIFAGGSKEKKEKKEKEEKPAYLTYNIPFHFYYTPETNSTSTATSLKVISLAGYESKDKAGFGFANEYDVNLNLGAPLSSSISDALYVRYRAKVTSFYSEEIGLGLGAGLSLISEEPYLFACGYLAGMITLGNVGIRIAARVGLAQTISVTPQISVCMDLGNKPAESATESVVETGEITLAEPVAE